MAAKDAVRRWHWSRAGGPLFPVEVEVANDLVGRPMVLGPIDGLEVSIAHTEWVAVAAVSEGPPVGVDIERVEPKERSFVDLALTAGGAAPACPADRSADEWVIRAWTAKEAVAKARGTGLEGRPTAFELVALDGDTVEVQRPRRREVAGGDLSGRRPRGGGHGRGPGRPGTGSRRRLRRGSREPAGAGSNGRPGRGAR